MGVRSRFSVPYWRYDLATDCIAVDCCALSGVHVRDYVEVKIRMNEEVTKQEKKEMTPAQWVMLIMMLGWSIFMFLMVW